MICNTWFEKKGIHKSTWQHPRSKKWQCIHDMQHVCRGLVPVRDEAGNPCLSAVERQQCWRRHFTAVLNQKSHFDAEELARAEQRPLRAELEETSSEEELV